MPKPFFLAVFALIAQAATADLAVHTYTSAGPAAVNTHAVETGAGLVIIGTQLTFSDARSAVTHISRIGEDVTAIVVPGPHLDQFGGLQVFRDAWPGAPVHASADTIESLRTDALGTIAWRNGTGEADFPSQAEVIASLPDHVLDDGDRLNIGDVTFDVIEVDDSSAASTLLLHVPAEGVLFGAEIVDADTIPFLKDADLNVWIAAIEGLRDGAGRIDTVHGAHATASPAVPALDRQLAILSAYRDLIDDALADDGILSIRERAEGVQTLQDRFPDNASVFGLSATYLIALNLGWQADRRSGS